MMCASAQAQQFDYVPPPMFGAVVQEKVFSESVDPGITVRSEFIRIVPVRRPDTIGLGDRAIVPSARPNVPARIISTRDGPSMPASPRMAIHKSSIVIEDEDFTSPESLARNLSAFGDPEGFEVDELDRFETDLLEDSGRSLSVVKPTGDEVVTLLSGGDALEIEPVKMLGKIYFERGEDGLSEPMIEELYHKVLQKMILLSGEFGEVVRFQVVSFASKGDDAGRLGISAERRMALSRALSVQRWLVDQGIDPGRIDVKARGANDANDDRVDFYALFPE